MTKGFGSMLRTATVMSVVGLTAVMALGGCARPERAAQGDDETSAAPATPASARWTGPAGAGEPVEGLGGKLRGVDVCVFNRRSESFTVEFHPDAQVQGSPTVDPGGWYCGYLRDSVLSIYLDGQIFLDSNTLYFTAKNDIFTYPIMALYPSLPGLPRTCESSKYLDVGESFVTDTGLVRYTSGRNADDDSWKYLTIVVEPSQGASPPDCAT